MDREAAACLIFFGKTTGSFFAPAMLRARSCNGFFPHIAKRRNPAWQIWKLPTVTTLACPTRFRGWNRLSPGIFRNRFS